jgi:hypothetical protein
MFSGPTSTECDYEGGSNYYYNAPSHLQVGSWYDEEPRLEDPRTESSLDHFGRLQLDPIIPYMRHPQSAPAFEAVTCWNAVGTLHSSVPQLEFYGQERLSSEERSLSSTNPWSAELDSPAMIDSPPSAFDCGYKLNSFGDFPGGGYSSGIVEGKSMHETFTAQSCGIAMQDIQPGYHSCSDEYLGDNNAQGDCTPQVHSFHGSSLDARDNPTRSVDSISLDRPMSDSEDAEHDGVDEMSSVSDYSPDDERTHKPTVRAPKAKVRMRQQKSKLVNTTKVTKRSHKKTASMNAGRLATPPSSPTSSEAIACPECKMTHRTKGALLKHISTSHTRPFVCTFSIYGCSQTFGSKNEWKRHVSSQHLRLGYWRCDGEGCVSNVTASKTGTVENNDFNRKDLFTQHLRRMHKPANGASEEELDLFTASLETIVQRCYIRVRSAPPRAQCGYCSPTVEGSTFFGDSAWEKRMEHVGKHLEGGASKKLAWREDLDLRSWLESEGLIQRTQNSKGEEKWALSQAVVEEGGARRGKKA